MTDVDEAPAERTPIVRDSTFVRFAADRAIIHDLGRDLEVSFLQYGGKLSETIDRGEFEEVLKTPVITEVARMRIGFAAMVNLMMTFLNGGISEGKIKGENVLASITEWVEAAEQAEQVSSSENQDGSNAE